MRKFAKNYNEYTKMIDLLAAFIQTWKLVGFDNLGLKISGQRITVISNMDN